jgi:hypothetical protein
MKQTINLHEFRQSFSNRPDNFSYEGLEILFNWFEEYESDNGIELELDPIGICCEYIEMTPQEVLNDFDTDLDPNSTDLLNEVFEWLNDETMALGITPQGTIVFANY